MWNGLNSLTTTDKITPLGQKSLTPTLEQDKMVSSEKVSCGITSKTLNVNSTANTYANQYLESLLPTSGQGNMVSTVL